MTRLPRMSIETMNRFEILSSFLRSGIILVRPSVDENLFVDTSDGYSTVLSSGSDEGIVERRPSGIENWRGVSSA